ncbi:MAG: helix-turn-helix domain-containing protein [Butyrivibrio sp.]
MKLLYPVSTPMECITVKYVSVLETPVEDFVRHYEIELSTALSIRDDFNKLDDFIRKIIDSGASAIVFAFPNDEYDDAHPIFSHITETFCDSNFPILISPWFQKFAEIIEDSMKKIWSLNQAKVRLREDFIIALAENRDIINDKLVSIAMAAEIDTSFLFKCIIGKNEQILSKNESNTIQEQIRIAAKRLHYSIISCYYDDTLIFILGKPKENADDFDINDFLDRMDRIISGFINVRSFYWGYDSTPYALCDITKCYSNARNALEYCTILKPETHRNEYNASNWGILYSTLCNNKAILNLAQNVLDVLIEYDNSKNSNLIETLKVYFDTNYNISETARKLYIHRQSLLYRINRIEQLCNVSFKNHSQILLLELCIHIHEYNANS